MVDTESDAPTRQLDMPRGIFTDEDRAYLKLDREEWVEEEEIKNPAQSAYARGEAISNRLYSALWDLPSCLYYLTPEIRRKTFKGGFFDSAMWIPFYCITNAIGFLLLGLMEQREKDLDDEEFLEHVVETSLDRMLWGSNERIGTNTGDIEVDIQIEGWRTQKDYESHMDPEDLTGDSLEWLFRMGEITREEFARGILSADSDAEE